MCGSSAKFNTDGDVAKYSGAFEGSVKKPSGKADDEGRMVPSSKVSSFRILLGKPRCVELGS